MCFKSFYLMRFGVYRNSVRQNREEAIQQLFRNMASRINKLRTHPEFYHSLLNNCTNNIVFHTYDLTEHPINWLDPRIAAPGYADRLAYSEGLIGNPGQSFTELKTECRIDEIARRVGITTRFSEDIRERIRK